MTISVGHGPFVTFDTDGSAKIYNTDGKNFRIDHVHKIFCCQGEYCVLHNPSNHFMSEWPLVVKYDNQFFRVCSHEVIHPDPDFVGYATRRGVKVHTEHDCDGCCNECCIGS